MNDSRPTLAEIIALTGSTLLQIQRTEFIIQGLIAHLKSDILQNNKAFKNLTPLTFLSDNEEAKKCRRQTLGVLLEFFNKEVNLLNERKLETFLINRNKLVHSFWREEISNRSNPSKNFEIAYIWLKNLHNEAIDIEKTFKGLLYIFIETLAKKHNKSDEMQVSLQSLEGNLKNLFAAIK
ncbi:hypothetical protein [Pontibacter fetidus]|uniref:Uncharacterized protein n=1 Tax=Pontibacter fetidus TaxID=2700082 RepID=A0A6B2HAL0_9BACT|nr:hypothetical protein [Pontibacter fetidus]NDK57380.1 hypothetical protein [Pontibacter fetidus]